MVVKIEVEYWNTEEEKALMKALAGQIEKIVSWARIHICGPKGDRDLFLDLDRVTPEQLFAILKILEQIGTVEEIFAARYDLRIRVSLNKR